MSTLMFLSIHINGSFVNLLLQNWKEMCLCEYDLKQIII